MRPSPKSTIKRSGLRTALRVVGWIIATLALLIALAAAWAWSNRYELIERQAITYLDSLGIKADLTIKSANGQRADIRNVSLAYDDTPFLTVKRLQATYQWRDLLNGKVERLDFTGLDAVITVNENGQIIDGWRPPSTGNGAGFPARGIGVKDGTILLKTPYGDMPITAEANIAAVDRFDLTGTLQPFTLTRDAMSVSADGPVTVSRKGGPYIAALPSTRLSLTHPAASLSQTRLAMSGTFQPGTNEAIGQARLLGGKFDMDAGITGAIRNLGIDGVWRDGRLTADIDTDLSAVSVTDPQRRKTLSRTLSLADALSNVPVAQNFAPGLVAPISDLLIESDVSAALSVQLTDRERQLRLRGPMTLQANRTKAVITPVPDAPLYQYSSSSDHYAVAMQAALSRPLPITLAPLRVKIRSSNGLTVDGLASASGQLKTQTEWRAATQDGRPARLGPLSVGFDYTAPLDAPSRLSLRGTANYDGDIPGGYAQGLIAGGTLTASLQDTRTLVDFAPNQTFKVARLETTSEWLIEDFEGQLKPASPLYRRNGTQNAVLRTALLEAKLTASRAATDLVEAADLDIQFGRADLAGEIRANTQSWDIDFADLALQSDTFPVPETDLALPSGNLSVALSNDARSSFALTAPGSTVITPLYRVSGMAIEAAGTAERYTMSYAGGRVKVIPQTDASIPLPVLPVSGTLLFDDGGFTGLAQTSLPRVPDTPVDIDFSYIDGQGIADIDIRNLRFRPGELQPQDLAPTLRGKIAQVEGGVNADLRVLFGGDTPPSGSGIVEIVNMSLGTAPGPVTGLSGTVELTSLFPVTTAPDQTLSISTFNPGFALENGELTYALVEEGVAISRAQFPLGDGQVSFDPFTWIYGAAENRVTLRVGGVEVGDFLSGLSDGRLTITGALEGTIPVVVKGIDVLVESGRLEVKNGGFIRYQGKELSDATNNNEVAAFAFEALKNFNYQKLFMEIDGPLDGEIKIGLEFAGSNPEVFYNIPFQFDVTVEGELFNIARSLNPNGLQQRVLTSVQNKENAE